jgi:hypothetical protein
MITLFALGLLSSTWVAAQSATGSGSSSSPQAQNPSPSLESLPSITPFQIPPGVLQGLGLPLVIPAMEPAPRQQGGNAKGGSSPGQRPAPWLAPAAPDMGAGRRGNPYGTQGGLPFDRCELFLSLMVLKVC